jgi:amino acid adenylation domain-containing protein/thioester reductase-like protein
MDLRNYLEGLSRLEIKIWVEDERLRVKAPAGTLTQEVRDTLARHRDEIIAFLKKGDGAFGAFDLVPRSARTDRASLSSSQLRMWFMEQLVPGTPLYHLHVRVRFERLDPPALQRAFEALSARHEILRTVFGIHEGEPFQRVEQTGAARLAFEHHSGIPAAQRKPMLQRLAAAHVAAPFDLERTPPIRLTVVTFGDDEHWLLLTLHHIIGDAVSMRILLGELFTHYEAQLTHLAQASIHSTHELPPLTIQYADYAAWEKKRLQGTDFDAEREYWRERLRDLAPLRLPEDHAHRGPRTYAGDTIEQQLPIHVIQQLHERARESGVSIYALLLSAFALVLRRYACQDEFAIATVVGGRNHSALDPLIGCFVNTLLIRCDLSGNPDLTEMATRTSRSVIEALRYQALPYQDVLTLVSDKERGREDLGRVCFVYEPPSPPAGGRVELELDTADGAVRGIAKFDLMLSVRDDGDGLRATYQFRTDLFDRETVQRLAGYFRRAVSHLSANVRSSVFDVELMEDAEREALVLDHFTSSVAPILADAAVGATALKCPDEIALICGDQALTFRELEQLVQRIAGGLVAEGVAPGDRVGVYLDRSIFAPAVVLGIMRAGAAYVPVDTDWPHDRVMYVLTDAGVRIVVSTEHRAQSLAATAPVVTTEALLAGEPDTGLAAGRDRCVDDLAYIIYTSGSTGRPKGVMVGHAQLANLFATMDRVLGSAPGVWLAPASLAFDISVVELLWTLSRGFRVVFTHDGDRDARAGSHHVDIPASIARHGVTHLQCTPSRAQLLLAQEDGPEALGRLQLCIATGEALPPKLAEQLLATGVGAVVDAYGPTETTVFASTYRLPSAVPMHTVPIGRAVDNTALYVLDDRQRLVPTGAIGELYIGGACVALGYWNQPALTTERFLDDPFRPGARRRMYRTGDLVRYGRDGQLEFLGRVDHQIKLRGYRIELGEIESLLLAECGVQAAVVLHHDGAGDPELVAYCVRSSHVQHSDDLRRALRAKVPEYMVPAQFIWADALPLNSSGKIDRKALPTPAAAATTLPGAVVGTELENEIAGIWREVLRVPEVGLNDAFFDLGGHSMLLLRVRSRLAEVLRRPIPLVALFEYPTVRALAEYLGANGPRQRSADRERTPRRVLRSADDIAVVGWSGRFPGARSVDELWRGLLTSACTVRRFERAELESERIPSDLLASPTYVRSKGIIEDAEDFDAELFGYTARDAELMDPQHRVILECAWEAFEDAGTDPRQFLGRVGVFVGAATNTYLLGMLHSQGLPQGDLLRIMLLNEKDFLASRISHYFDLRGPSVNVQSACSTSLVAIHQACQSLLAGDSDMGLAGGVSLSFPTKSGYEYREAGIMSRDGLCRPFDADASGTVFGNGIGLVVLRRLADALRDGDRIHAVIKGIAVNNDGASKVGFAAPSIKGQASVIAEAIDRAGIAPHSVAYVEAHGTGTALGDPIEVSALSSALRATERESPCLVGSIKSNLGHLDTAAGVTGFIKAALAVREGVIPPSLHFSSPNPEIDFDALGLRVCSAVTPWPAMAGARRAGVSSFGIGGTNAHAVLEEPPRPAPGVSPREYHVFPVSGRTAAACQAIRDRLSSHLDVTPDSAADVAFTLQTGRRALAARVAVVAHGCGEAARALQQATIRHRAAGARPRAAVFACAGASGIEHGILSVLTAEDAAFRGAFAWCAGQIRTAVDIDLGARLGEAERRAGTDLAADPEHALFAFALGWTHARLLGQLGLNATRYVALDGRGAPLASMLAGRTPLHAALLQLRAEPNGSTSDAPDSVGLSVGQDHVMVLLGTASVAADQEAEMIPLASRSAADSPRAFAMALARLWVNGFDLKWAALYEPGQCLRVALPGYAFERTRYSLYPTAAQATRHEAAPPATHRSNGQSERRGERRPVDRINLTTPFRTADSEFAKRMVEVWESLFAVHGIGVDDDFFALGGDSMMAIELCAKMDQACDSRVSAEMFAENPTIASLETALHADAAARERLRSTHATAIASTRLDPALRIAARATSASEPFRVLLTGATGYLGPFLIRALLEQLPRAQIVCLVRASTGQQASERLETRLRAAKCWSSADGHRLTALPGDVARPHLGLEVGHWRALAHDVDAIVHCAATVNFALSFDSLRATNVEGTENVIRLAADAGKALHHVSTLAIFEARQPSGETFSEDSPLECGRPLIHGYAESKWAAEKLVWEARDRGLPVAVYRPGAVCGHSESGVSNIGDFMSRMIRGVVELGRAPGLDGVLDMAPADYVANAIATGVRTRDMNGPPLHLVHPDPCRWSDVIAALRARGYAISEVPSESWLALLEEHVATQPDSVLYPLLPLLRRRHTIDVASATRFECAKSAVRLAGRGVRCKRIGADALLRYINFFSEVGYLPATGWPSSTAIA